MVNILGYGYWLCLVSHHEFLILSDCSYNVQVQKIDSESPLFQD